MTKSKIEIRTRGVRCNGRCHEIVVSAVKKYDGRTYLPARCLMKVDSNQNDLTESKGPGLAVRRPSRQNSMLPQIEPDLPRTKLSRRR